MALKDKMRNIIVFVSHDAYRIEEYEFSARWSMETVYEVWAFGRV